MRRKGQIPGEVGQEYRQARDAFFAERPNPSLKVRRRYGRIKGLLMELLEKRKLTYDQIAEIKLDDIPNFKRD